jgi:hypothetical protein
MRLLATLQNYVVLIITRRVPKLLWHTPAWLMSLILGAHLRCGHDCRCSGTLQLFRETCIAFPPR